MWENNNQASTESDRITSLSMNKRDKQLLVCHDWSCETNEAIFELIECVGILEYLTAQQDKQR